jgi:hypothetical protein
MTSPDLTVLRGFSHEKDELHAVRQLAEAISRPDAGLVVFFCSSRFDLPRLGAALRDCFSCPVLGCTTAGEIAGSGYAEGSLVGASLSSHIATCHHTLIEPLSDLTGSKADELARSMAQPLDRSSGTSRFGLLLVDGLSMAEEYTAAHLHAAFRGVPIVGGSAGDDSAFRETHVYGDGRFAKNAAAFCLVDTPLAFRTFKTQHFEPTDVKVVISEADPSRRRVVEIDGMPAAEGYAQALGLTPGQLTAGVFSAHPLILHLGDEYYVRSIQRVEDDGTLVFYCAIDNGLVLTIGRGVNLANNLRTRLDALEQEIGPLELILGCDCILRRQEAKEKHVLDDVDRVLQDFPIVGFSTYGEQLNGIHVNQTMTGIALGGRR